jgi:tungstate transport system permease protein
VGVYTQAFADAIALVLSGDPQVWQVITLSLFVSGTAVAIAMVVGIPAGYLLGVSRFGGRVALLILVNTAMSFPPVVIGLFVYLSLIRAGPLGFLDILYTPPAMILAQFLLAAPLVTGVTAASVSSVSRDVRLQVRALGASWYQEAYAVLREARRGVAASVVAGFGGVISEIGAVSIVGGNITHYTSVMTTSIASEVANGRFGKAMAWAMVLIGIAIIVNIMLTSLQNAGVSYER